MLSTLEAVLLLDPAKATVAEEHLVSAYCMQMLVVASSLRLLASLCQLLQSCPFNATAGAGDKVPVEAHHAQRSREESGAVVQEAWQQQASGA